LVISKNRNNPKKAWSSFKGFARVLAA